MTYQISPGRKWQPTPVLLPGKFHGWRSVVGYSPLGCKESDRTEQLHFILYPITIINLNYSKETDHAVKKIFLPFVIVFHRQAFKHNLLLN